MISVDQTSCGTYDLSQVWLQWAGESWVLLISTAVNGLKVGTLYRAVSSRKIYRPIRIVTFRSNCHSLALAVESLGKRYYWRKLTTFLWCSLIRRLFFDCCEGGPWSGIFYRTPVLVEQWPCVVWVEEDRLLFYGWPHRTVRMWSGNGFFDTDIVRWKFVVCNVCSLSMV